jgi:NADH:ubiquinone oxidoreductase subunit
VPRRWVVYKRLSEASKVPPAWHGWLHHTVDQTPDKGYQPRAWERPHEENPTGSARAKRPSGSILVKGERQPTGGDYRPWRPE